MEKFIELKSKVLPLPFANIDTDIIMPKEFLKSIQRTGFGNHIFAGWKNKEGIAIFDNNYLGAKILVTGENFGCGSSREHAVWGLKEFGFQAIIAPSFADIFYSNAIKNGLLPVILNPNAVFNIIHQAESNSNYILKLDLKNKTIILPDQKTLDFEIDPASQNQLLEGLDDIGQTLQLAKKIKDFEVLRKSKEPWIFELSV